MSHRRDSDVYKEEPYAGTLRRKAGAGLHNKLPQNLSQSYLIKYYFFPNI